MNLRRRSVQANGRLFATSLREILTTCYRAEEVHHDETRRTRSWYRIRFLSC